MININTRKKRIAFEVLIFLFTMLFSVIIFIIGDYFEERNYEKKEKSYNIINSRIDSLKDNVFRNRYLRLEEKNNISDYSYDSYKRKILNDNDSSFRRTIYERLCNQYSDYRNERTFEEFLSGFEYDSIHKIDEEISELEERNDTIPTKSRYTLLIILIVFIISYPFRFLCYLIKWSLNTLKDKTTEPNSKIEKREIEIMDTKNEIEEVNLKVESSFKNYFKYNNEYINGYSYWLRMFLGWFLTIFFGLGIILMSTTVYKRSKSLGFGKEFSIINSILIPILFIISLFVMVYFNLHINSSDDNIFYEFILLRILLTIPHLILIFKNGTRKKIGKFEINQ